MGRPPPWQISRHSVMTWLTSTDHTIINHSCRPIDSSICLMPLLLLATRGRNSQKFSEADDAILSQLGETQKLLRELEKLDPAMATAASTHETAIVELSEIARDLGRYAENLDLDPEQLAALEQRVSLFETLKRKYG